MSWWSTSDELTEARAAAVLKLNGLRVPSTVPELNLVASRAEVMDQSESIRQDDGRVLAYYLTQIVRNEAGEYFLLKTTDGKPYVKHLPQARAKIVLKSKYREK